MSEEGLTEEDGSDGGQFPGRYPKTKEWAETLLSAAEKYYYAGGDADTFIIQSWHALPKLRFTRSREVHFYGYRKESNQSSKIKKR